MAENIRVVRRINRLRERRAHNLGFKENNPACPVCGYHRCRCATRREAMESRVISSRRELDG